MARRLLPRLPRASNPPLRPQSQRRCVVTSDTLWAALALVLVIEGLLPFVSPQRWRRAVAELSQLPDSQLRLCAFFALGAGLLMLWL